MKHRSTGRAGRPARFVCIDVIRSLHSQGFGFRAIARCTGLGYGTVRRAFHGLAPLGVDQTADRQSVMSPTEASSQGSQARMSAAN